MSTMRIARVVAAKDLRIEWNSRVFVNQVLPFAGVTMVIFAFALDADSVHQKPTTMQRQPGITVEHEDLLRDVATSQSPPHSEVLTSSSRHAVTNLLAGYT